MEEVTQILEAVNRGEDHATDKLFRLLYEELRTLAASRLANEKPGQTLQPTALVHEAFLRMVGPDEIHWNGRAHFFGTAAEAMRRILIERARSKHRLKRGGDRDRVHLEETEWGEVELAVALPTEKLVEINDALEHLEQESSTSANVMKLRCFVGLSLQEIADVLHISRTTVTKHWAFARARMIDLLGDFPEDPPD